MAKTIRSHPTSYIFGLEPISWTTLILSKYDAENDTFSLFSGPPTGKKTGPERKQNAHGPSLHISFLSKCHFVYCIYNTFSIFQEKTTCLNYCHILTISCISENIGDPILLLLLFQNKTLISKLEPYPKGIFHQIWDPSIALSCLFCCIFN